MSEILATENWLFNCILCQELGILGIGMGWAGMGWAGMGRVGMGWVQYGVKNLLPIEKKFEMESSFV